MTPFQPKSPPVLLWWILWGGIIVSATMIYFVVQPTGQMISDALRYLPLVPFVLATVLRWLLLPRLTRARAFPFFIFGLALAEATVFFGIFLAPTYRQDYFWLGLVGLAQFAPLFVSDERA